ncbi:hypothetical protein V2154_16835 [Ewingella sp. CoE-038-23]|uniref:hypothetical protein n=1 Tax=Ewingella docleensis TaxID=3118588 RepID=UPI0033653355
MKWEILKGSEDDFEGYHEEVTHIYSTRRGRAVSNGVAPSLDGHLVAERRPITEPDVSQQVTTEWDGDGLPPVGSFVECFSKNEWRKCKVTFAGEPGSKTEALVFDVKTTRPFWADEFRPIRSPEDVARERAIGAIAELCRSSASNGHSSELIYDAIAAGNIPGVKLE